MKILNRIKELTVEQMEAGLRKMKDLPEPCLNQEHSPPQYIVLEPGEYEYTCPSCGRVTKFTVPRIIC